MGSKTKEVFQSFSPDELCELYQKNPDRFSKLAHEAIDRACIGKSGEESMKLRRMQWQIDMQLRKGKTPLQRMQIMENIFYTKVFGEDGELSQLMHNCKTLVRTVRGDEKVSKRPSLYVVK